MKVLICLLMAAAGWGQVLSFSSQGAEFLRSQVGSVIPGLQGVGVIVCWDGLINSISGGAIYQKAAEQGYNWILPAGVPSITTRRVQKSKAQHAVDWLKYGSIVGAMIASRSVIKVPDGVLTGLIMGHSFIDDIQPFFAARVPDPGTLLGNLIDPSKTYQLGPGVCVNGYLVAQFKNAPRPAQTPKVAVLERAPGMLASISWGNLGVD